MSKKETAKKEETAVVAQQNTSLATIPLTSFMEADGEGSQSGFENVTSADTAIPFIYILQSLSPQVKKGMPQRIDGAEEGDLFNNVSQQIIKPPITVIPCAFQKAYVEWITRENGGGFVTTHQDESILRQCTKNEKNVDILSNGNSIIPTAYHFVLVQDAAGGLSRAVLSFTRTQLKKSRRWMSMMMDLKITTQAGKILRPPMYSHCYQIGTEMETKDQYSWFGFTIGAPKMIDNEQVYLLARAFHKECVEGSVKVKEPVMDAPVDESQPSPDSCF